MKNTAKSTFLNLPQERQEFIIYIAIKEFVQNDYRNVSLSTIIKKLQLAKGSFYRYFDSKKDLYIYLLQHVTSGRYEEINSLSEELPQSLEELLVLNFQNKIEFDKMNPLYSGFIYQVMREMGTPELMEISNSIKRHILQITAGILTKYKLAGKLTQEVDLDSASWAIVQIQFSIHEYLNFRYKLNFLKNIEEGKPIFGEMEGEIMQVVKQFAKILSNGISNTNHYD